MRMLLFMFGFAFFLSCKTKQPTTLKSCETMGTVVDLDGLDGCGYLIRLKDGKLLNPASMPEGFHFRDNQTVRFDYKPLKDMMSICMAESQIVEITCIQDTKAANDNTDCANITNPFAVAWMDKAIDRHNPVKIIKYKMGGKWIFSFQAVPTTYVYDCEGQLLCQSNGDKTDECHRQYLNQFNKAIVIWQGEGVWD